MEEVGSASADAADSAADGESTSDTFRTRVGGAGSQRTSRLEASEHTDGFSGTALIGCELLISLVGDGRPLGGALTADGAESARCNGANARAGEASGADDVECDLAMGDMCAASTAGGDAAAAAVVGDESVARPRSAI